MNKCDVCGNTTFHRQSVEHVFNVEGHHALVQDIPARVCDRCGEATFDRETVEHVRRMLHGEVHPKKRTSMEVFAYA
jgi:YgiT-type zinc finger domain-containing protein